MDLCQPVTKRVIRYMQISQSLESAMSAATRAAFRVSRQTLQKVSTSIAAPALPSTLPRGAAVSFRVLRPAYRRRGFVGTTRRRSRIAEVIAIARRFTPRAARVEFVRPEEEPIGSSEGGYSDATRDVRILTIVHVDPR